MSTPREGCRAGDACPFIHDPARLKDKGLLRTEEKQSHPNVDVSPTANPASKAVGSTEAKRQHITAPVAASKVVRKPVTSSQVEDPRDFQFKQLRRRFSPSERIDHGVTIFTLRLVPSDPDFPFEMEGLDCVLHVPLSYPRSGKPTLSVKNKEMGRGYQINVEKGFDDLVAEYPRSTLLSLMNALDKRLESLLTERKAETVKIMPNTYQAPRPENTAAQGFKSSTIPFDTEETSVVLNHTQEEKGTAELRRETETRQLEARLGRLPLFSKASDGIVYTIPLEPRRRAELPVPLQSIKSVKLFVPLQYPLKHCRIEIQGVAKEAANHTEKSFESRARNNLGTSLLGHINYLSQNMHVLAIEPLGQPSPTVRIADLQIKDDNEEEGIEQKSEVHGTQSDDRSHIKIIPRPPEWSQTHEEEGIARDDTDSYDSEDDSMDEVEAKVSTTQEGSTPVSNPDRGISFSFPHLELYSIEILELTSLSIIIKCERCKEGMDINNLWSSHGAHRQGSRVVDCKKCASPLGICYRRELMHINSVRAGYLDLDGCIVVDMLPR
ncbi:hypothetical protein MMC09_001633 [Bachmanniomyces sp. S44760]|nr:hypothetical protein [Bachmanniomyces sp. S44760]